MGLLVNGVWQEDAPYTEDKKGRFLRQESVFRDFITADGSSGFPAEANRYHLYIAYACPWACRTLIFRSLLGLKDIISVSIVTFLMGEQGWTFTDKSGGYPDHLFGAKQLHKIYTKAKSDYTGRVTVPVLWDKTKNTIVNNESSEIIRMLNSEFNSITGNKIDFYPENLRKQIDEINEKVYNNVNNGVYRCGFATTQEAYEEAFDQLFNALDDLEKLLSQQRYLAGNQITEADWRLFTTLLRFDPVYVGHFKCNKKRIKDYPNLDNYLRELYQTPGVKETVNMEHIKHHYYQSHTAINPTQIVPKGPELNLDAPHNRK